MEIMINGQLVTCSPKEYKELMDMGIIPGQPAGTTAVTQLDDGWKDQLAELAKRYPKIEPETPKFGTCTVTPLYGCTVPAEEATKPVYAIRRVDDLPTGGYLRKGVYDSMDDGTALNRVAIPLVTPELCEALLFTSMDAASKFCDEWNDCKSHRDSQVKFYKVYIPPNAIMTYRGGDRVEIEDFNMDMHSISLAEPVCTRQDADGTIKAYFLKDEQDGLYLENFQTGTFTSDSTKALHFKYETEAKLKMYEYNGSKHHTREVQVEEKDLPVENSREAPGGHMMFACRLVDGSSQYIQDATGECTFTSEPTDAMLFTSLDLADRMADRLNEPSFGNPFKVEAVPVMVL